METKSGKSGTYYDIVFNSASNKKLDNIIKELGLTKDFNDAYHCTLTYSKKRKTTLKTSIGIVQTKGGDYKDFNAKNELNILVKIKSFGHFDTNDGKNLHIVLDCSWCEKQHNRSIKAGCTFDYDTYTPHVTLMYDCGDFLLDDNEDLWKKFIGEKLYIVEERISPLNDNWVEDSKKDDIDSEDYKDNTNEKK